MTSVADLSGIKYWRHSVKLQLLLRNHYRFNIYKLKSGLTPRISPLENKRQKAYYKNITNGENINNI